MSYLGQVELKSSEIRRIDVTGSTSATHTLTWTPANEQSLIITINGIKQQNNYSISGTTLTLDDALLSADKMEVIGILDIGLGTVPPEDSVGVAELSATGTASSSTFLRGDNSWSAVDTSQITINATAIDGNKDDIAILGFKIAANGSLAKYNLVDQTIDAFEDASGVDASESASAVRNSANYYSGFSNPTATGGTTSTSGDYTFHYFTASGDFVTDTAQSMDVLLVAGGGGGGRHSGGGGGAGGLIYQTGRSITAATHAYVQGAGGVTKTSDGVGNDGGDSTWNSLTSKGGGGGGYHSTTGNGGGSGGGSSRALGAGGSESQTGQAGDSGTYGFGNDGGSGDYGSSPYPGAGGGGATAAGAAATSSSSGVGGAGKELTIFSSFGVSGFFAGGGGGQTQSGASEWGAGGSGGGGRGGGPTGAAAEGAGRSGTANTGSGGGGSSSDSTFGTYGAAGGSGTLIIRRLTVGTVPTDMTLISANQAAQAAPTKGDIVFTYTNGAGSTTLGTDVTAEISADGGSTWTPMTLGSEGSTGSHNIATAHDVTITSTITAPYNMAYRIKTINQGAGKSTRIQAVSLGWL
jgi:hypothetical protein